MLCLFELYTDPGSTDPAAVVMMIVIVYACTQRPRYEPTNQRMKDPFNQGTKETNAMLVGSYWLYSTIHN